MIYLKTSDIATEEYIEHEVDSGSKDCIFYKEVTVQRYDDWVWYDLPNNIIPLAILMSGDLTYYDFNGIAKAEIGLRYKNSGEVIVMDKSYNIDAGKTISFNQSVDLSLKEPALQIGHKFNTRTNRNSCTVKIYKWLELKTKPTSEKAVQGFIKTNNGVKKLTAAIVNLETGPKVFFGDYDLGD